MRDEIELFKKEIGDIEADKAKLKDKALEIQELLIIKD